MRRTLLPVAVLSLLAATAPLSAQGLSVPASSAIQQRATVLNQRIDAAVRAGKLSRSRAASLHTSVGRVQTSAGNYEARSGTVPADELRRMDRQLSAVEAAVPGAPSRRPANIQATADMRSRIAAAIERIRVTEQHGKITPTRSATLRRQLTQAEGEMARQSRRQGFVSAATLASYDRLIVGVDEELSNDAGPRSYGNDALPSAEVTAFQHADARLHYRNARIDYDADRCAVYQGVAPDGQVRREPLRDAAGRPICSRR